MKNSYRFAPACLRQDTVSDMLLSFSQHVRHGESERLPREEFKATRQDIGPHIERAKQFFRRIVSSAATSSFRHLSQSKYFHRKVRTSEH